VGDNRNARVDPEVIAPLSKLKELLRSEIININRSLISSLASKLIPLTRQPQQQVNNQLQPQQQQADTFNINRSLTSLSSLISNLVNPEQKIQDTFNINRSLISALSSKLTPLSRPQQVINQLQPQQVQQVINLIQPRQQPDTSNINRSLISAISSALSRLVQPQQQVINLVQSQQQSDTSNTSLISSLSSAFSSLVQPQQASPSFNISSIAELFRPQAQLTPGVFSNETSVVLSGELVARGSSLLLAMDTAKALQRRQRGT